MQSVQVNCPYCGENFEALIDTGGEQLDGDSIDYFEDCYVCCQPIAFQVSSSGTDDDSDTGKLLVRLRRDDE